MTTYPYAGPPIPARPVTRSALPDEPRRYTELLRGPRRRWWRPIVALLLVAGLFIVTSFLAMLPVLVFGLITGESDLVGYLLEAGSGTNIGVPGFLYLNLVLGSLIPVAGLSIWIAHRIRPRYVSSVAGGIRWRWLARCALVVVPVWAIYLGISFLLDRPTGGRPDQWVTLLILAVLLAPFQSAGEEYIFRGWLMQNVGSYFSRPLVGAIVSIAASTIAFSAAHGSPDPWVLGSIGTLAVAAGIAAYRTGGIEAGIVMHAANNVLLFILVIIFGGFQESFVGGDTKGTPLSFLVGLVAQAVVLLLILWQAKRIGLDPLYRPRRPGAAAELEGSDTTPDSWPEASWNPIPELNRGSQ